LVDSIEEAPIPVDGFADAGLVELLALDNHTFIAKKRSFSLE